jgi:hypothetical protein
LRTRRIINQKHISSKKEEVSVPTVILHLSVRIRLAGEDVEW